MTTIISHYGDPTPVDLDQLTEIIWSGWTGDFFFDSQESNGVVATFDWDVADEALYKAVQQLVETWDSVEDDEIGGVIYRRPVKETKTS